MKKEAFELLQSQTDWQAQPDLLYRSGIAFILPIFGNAQLETSDLIRATELFDIELRNGTAMYLKDAR